MNELDAFPAFVAEFEDENEATWHNIYERHQDIIRIKKAKIAVPNLQTIVTTTLSISNRSSFHSMSLRDLSREAGMSMGALYSYIESKEHLLAMILGHVLHLVETVLGGPVDGQADPKDQLHRLLRRHIFLTEVMQPWFFFAYMEAKSFDHWGRRMAIESELRTQNLIAACLVDGQAGGVFRPTDPTMTASLVKPLLQDWYLKRWKYRRQGISPDDYAGWVIRFVGAFVDQPPPSCRHEN